MLQFHLSDTLADDLQMHLEASTEPDFQALQWYAHRVIVARRKCIIVMERQSRYAMVFCGLRKPDFARFPKIFQERLLREVLSITRLKAKERAVISNLVTGISQPQNFQSGSDENMMECINQIVSELGILVNQQKKPLPIEPDQAATFGVKVNEMQHRRNNGEDIFYPAEVFRHLWLGMLNIINKSPAKDIRSFH